MLIPFNEARGFQFKVPEYEVNCHYENLVYTLDSVVHVFKDQFPSRYFKTLTVSNPSPIGNPIIYNTKNIIYLNVNPLKLDQAAYQFAHELCHYLIPEAVALNLWWFEESICETASYFFLPKVTEYWYQTNLTKNNKAYLFTKYAVRDSKKACKFNLHHEDEILNLERNCYQRNKNAYIANLLLPIFNKYNKTWLAIPYLCKIPSGLTLKKALNEWIILSPPVCRLGLVSIYNLFF